jgi:hypothetical protein
MPDRDTAPIILTFVQACRACGHRQTFRVADAHPPRPCEACGGRSEWVEMPTLDEMIEAHRRRPCDKRTLAEVRALMAAGWLFVLPEGAGDHEPFSWRWRRPPRGNRKVGRLFASTGQAFGALMREGGSDQT